MTRYVGPSGPEDTALLPRQRIIDLIDVRIETALADFERGGTGGAVNPVYVRRSATGAGDGSDFDNAYGIFNIGDAIANAAPGSTVHILSTDTYTGVENINVPAYATTHLSVGNEVTIQASDAAGDLVLPIDPTTDYTTVAEAVAFADDAVAYASKAAADTAVAGLWAAVDVEDTFDYTGDALILEGNRTPDPRTTAEEYKAPINVGGWWNGQPMFKLNGVSHLIFKGIGFRNVGNGCFLINGTCDNVHFEDCAARNVYRYIEMAGPNLSSAVQPYNWIDGSDTRSDVRGMEKGPCRIKNGSHDIDIIDPHWDLRRQYGDPFPNGLESFAGSAYNTTGDAPGGYGPRDITVKGVDRIAVVANAYDGRPHPQFRNGDGLTFEGICTNVVIENVLLAGHTDAGLDWKVYPSTVNPDSSLNNVITLGCRNNLKMWREVKDGTDPWGKCYSIRPVSRGTHVATVVEVIDPNIKFAELHVMDDTSTTFARADSAGDGPLIVESGKITFSGSNPPANTTLDPSVTYTPVAHQPRMPPEMHEVTAAGVSESEIMIGWGRGGHIDSQNYTFDVELDEVVQTGFTTTEAESQIAVTGLDTNTEYVVRVRGKNTNDEPGLWSLPITTSTLPAAVASFTDDFSTDQLATGYNYAGGNSGQWQFVGDGTIRGPAGDNTNRFASPIANLTADHKVTATITQWDATRGFGVVARAAGATGLCFQITQSGRFLLIREGGAGEVRSKFDTIPAAPLTLGVQAVGDTVTCFVNGEPFNWAAAGAPEETEVTVTGYTSARVSLYCRDADTFFSDITAEAI